MSLLFHFIQKNVQIASFIYIQNLILSLGIMGKLCFDHRQGFAGIKKVTNMGMRQSFRYIVYNFCISYETRQLH